ncbi:hypothetical protein [Actinocatenispora comari]|uniref:Uncharacterized protein n=1 Tax=Actinocatenispora comari TaxID=2807577 RepID=A0A8J4AI71_9ACTN|nr:hypothetical protein [Actinocatenispora comari]GIL31741.1 hypothetical protein NUM_69950 [Actinocatenispora comari]
MDAATYAAAMCAAFLVGVAALGTLAVYLLDRAANRRDRAAQRPRDRAAQRPRDPYADAQALAARRRAEHLGRARVPVATRSAVATWPR